MFKIEKFDLLVSVYIFCIMIAEIMGGKTVPIMKLFGYQLNGSVALLTLPIIFSINDTITEVFGKERTRSVIRSGLLIIFLLFIFSLIATALPPSTRFASREAAFDTIFQLSARIAAASLTAFTIAEFLDLFIFVKLRERLKKYGLWFRNNVSNIIAQFVDTTVFMFLAFYALNKPFGDNVSYLWSLILPYWLLKCFMSVIETPFVYWGVRWLKEK